MQTYLQERFSKPYSKWIATAPQGSICVLCPKGSRISFPDPKEQLETRDHNKTKGMGWTKLSNVENQGTQRSRVWSSPEKWEYKFKRCNCLGNEKKIVSQVHNLKSIWMTKNPEGFLYALKRKMPRSPNCIWRTRNGLSRTSILPKEDKADLVKRVGTL